MSTVSQTYSRSPSPSPSMSMSRSRSRTKSISTNQHVQQPLHETFWQTYTPAVNADPWKFVRKRIRQLGLIMDKNLPEQGSLCNTAPTDDRKLFVYQLVHTILASPFSPLKRLLVVASTGTGKTCVLVGVANYWMDQAIREDKRNSIVFVGANTALFDNFIKESKMCPGTLRDLFVGTFKSDDASFKSYVRKYIFPMDYTQFGNAANGHYIKYAALGELKNKLILLDEAHLLVDSPDPVTLEPRYDRVPAQYQANIREVFTALSDPQSQSIFEGSTLVGATATPLTESAMEFFLLVNMMSAQKLSVREMSGVLQQVVDIEARPTMSRDDLQSIRDIIDKFEPVMRSSLAMYITKTSEKVLDTSIFPQMQFETIEVPQTDEQERGLHYTGKRVDPDKYSTIAADLKKLHRYSIMNPTNVFADRFRMLSNASYVAQIAPKFVKTLEILRRDILPSSRRTQTGKAVIFVKNKKDGAEALFSYLTTVGGMNPVRIADADKTIAPGDNVLMLATVGDTSKLKEYAVKSTHPQDAVRHIVEKFNSVDNTHGQKYPVLILQAEFMEGLDLKDVTHIIMLQDPGKQGLYEQIIGRGVRNCSHNRLPFDQWVVKIIHIYSKGPSSAFKSADDTIRAVRLKSKRIYDLVMKAAQQFSIDCIVASERYGYSCSRSRSRSKSRSRTRSLIASRSGSGSRSRSPSGVPMERMRHIRPDPTLYDARTPNFTNRAWDALFPPIPPKKRSVRSPSPRAIAWSNVKRRDA